MSKSEVSLVNQTVTAKSQENWTHKQNLKCCVTIYSRGQHEYDHRYTIYA